MKYRVPTLDNNQIIKKEIEARGERTFEGKTYLYFDEDPFVCNKIIAEEVTVELSENTTTDSKVS